ncbi:DUF443 family protein [uncultured Enterococcus sp.]|uniref:DUF443 family protein n=1 Tax=uncultured Enterococcus sp. TaxID=167972 RepID=UPI002AA5EFE5|nr:DUF443 family protein [uncultured Enterococcus sp.]
MEITKTENKRYKQLTYNGKSYLLDMDSNKLTWFFPFLVWFFPIKGYQDATLPLEKTEKPKKGGGLILLSSVLSGIMIRMTNRGFGDLSVYENYQQNFLYLLVGLVSAVLLIRYFYRYKKNELVLEGKKVVYVHFKGSFLDRWKYGYKVVFTIFSFYGIIAFLVYSFFRSFHNIIIVIPILPLVYLISIANTTILPPEKDYTIEISQKNDTRDK